MVALAENNFELSQNTAIRYMRLARMAKADPKFTLQGENVSLCKAIGEKQSRSAKSGTKHPSSASGHADFSMSEAAYPKTTRCYDTENHYNHCTFGRSDST
jgi:hypothetical protein